MKQVIIAWTLILPFVFATGNRLSAQGTKSIIESRLGKNFMNSVRNMGGLENPDLAAENILRSNEINTRAIRDFLTRFEGVEDAVWFSVPKGGNEAYFIRDGFGNRVIYNKSGGWQMSLLNYEEGKLPRDIRSLVKSNYYDYDLVLVEEVQTPGGTEYIVFMEDKSTLKLLRVTDKGEMDLLRELSKPSF
jgi:hypothetical protein